mgnify:CR=1 FL=1
MAKKINDAKLLKLVKKYKKNSTVWKHYRGSGGTKAQVLSLCDALRKNLNANDGIEAATPNFVKVAKKVLNNQAMPDVHKLRDKVLIKIQQAENLQHDLAKRLAAAQVDMKAQQEKLKEIDTFLSSPQAKKIAKWLSE